MNFLFNIFFQVKSTGCLNMLCQTSNHLLGIKNTLLSHKNGICTFMRCGNLTYDTWIWLKVTSMASTASNRKSAKIHKFFEIIRTICLNSKRSKKNYEPEYSFNFLRGTPRVISQMSASHECTDTVFMT